MGKILLVSFFILSIKSYSQISRYDSPAEQPIRNTYVPLYDSYSNIYSDPSSPQYLDHFEFASCSRYKREVGYSDYYSLKAIAILGSALNKAVNELRYNSTSDYIVLWFSQDQCAVIELDMLIRDDSYGFKTSGGNVKYKLNFLTGVDQDGTKWEISLNNNGCY